MTKKAYPAPKPLHTKPFKVPTKQQIERHRSDVALITTQGSIASKSSRPKLRKANSLVMHRQHSEKQIETKKRARALDLGFPKLDDIGYMDLRAK